MHASRRISAGLVAPLLPRGMCVTATLRLPSVRLVGYVSLYRGRKISSPNVRSEQRTRKEANNDGQKPAASDRPEADSSDRPPRLRASRATDWSAGHPARRRAARHASAQSGGVRREHLPVGLDRPAPPLSNT